MYRQGDIIAKLEHLGLSPLDLLIAGGTGAGKSTTINCIIGKEKAKVGYGSDPMTSSINHYNIDGVLRIWDTPGIGDSPEKDKIYMKNIREKLLQKCQIEGLNGHHELLESDVYLIDIALIIINGGSRDMSSTFELFQILAPYITTDRLIIGVNFADMEMCGRHWDYNTSCPQSRLKTFIIEKERSITERIRDNCGIDIERIVTYSALHKYNIDGLLNIIIETIPKRPRIL